MHTMKTVLISICTNVVLALCLLIYIKVNNVQLIYVENTPINTIKYIKDAKEDGKISSFEFIEIISKIQDIMDKEEEKK